MPTLQAQPVLSPPMSEHTDAELVQRTLAGETPAFEAIMRRHNRLLFRSARGIVGDDAEAQDVVQEAYLSAFTKLHSFRGDSALGTWLARIAINIALDVQRKQGRTVLVDAFADAPLAPGTAALEPAMNNNASTHEAPDTAAERKQILALLQGTIDSLPPIYRSVFILRAIQELSVEETAACLQVTGDVVKTRYLRARTMLRDALGARIEAHATHTYAFAGARCDAVVAHVLATLSQQRHRDSG